MTVERQTIHISDDAGRMAMLEKRTLGNAADDNDTEATLVRYVYSNHLQSASLELDNAARVISYEEYHPYGTTAYQAANEDIKACTNRYRYTGKERDEESGLYYHGARYYIPWLCRWTAVDPLESKFAGMSPYNYGNCNPITYNDPSGMSGEKGGLWFGYTDSNGDIGYRWAAGAQSFDDIKGNDRYSSLGLTGDVYQTLDYNDNEGKHTYLWADGTYSQKERTTGQSIKGWFGFDGNGYYRNEYSSGGFKDAGNYLKFLDNSAGSIWNFGAQIVNDVRYGTWEATVAEFKSYGSYFTTPLSQQWENTKSQFSAAFTNIRFYENVGGALMTGNASKFSLPNSEKRTIELNLK